MVNSFVQGEQKYCFWSKDGRGVLVNISFIEERKETVIADILFAINDFSRMTITIADCSLVEELLRLESPLEADGRTCPGEKPLVCDRTTRRQGRR